MKTLFNIIDTSKTFFFKGVFFTTMLLISCSKSPLEVAQKEYAELLKGDTTVENLEKKIIENLKDTILIRHFSEQTRSWKVERNSNHPSPPTSKYINPRNKELLLLQRNKIKQMKNILRDNEQILTAICSIKNPTIEYLKSEYKHFAGKTIDVRGSLKIPKHNNSRWGFITSEKNQDTIFVQFRSMNYREQQFLLDNNPFSRHTGTVIHEGSNWYLYLTDILGQKLPEDSFSFYSNNSKLILSDSDPQGTNIRWWPRGPIKQVIPNITDIETVFQAINYQDDWYEVKHYTTSDQKDITKLSGWIHQSVVTVISE